MINKLRLLSTLLNTKIKIVDDIAEQVSMEGKFTRLSTLVTIFEGLTSVAILIISVYELLKYFYDHFVVEYNEEEARDMKSCVNAVYKRTEAGIEDLAQGYKIIPDIMWNTVFILSKNSRKAVAIRPNKYLMFWL